MGTQEWWEVDADEREAPLGVLLRLRNTVPRKMATVTLSTPRLPQNTPLQPEAKIGVSPTTTPAPVRSTDISPPEQRVETPSVWEKLSRRMIAVKHLLHVLAHARIERAWRPRADEEGPSGSSSSRERKKNADLAPADTRSGS
jgi:hypothetical protein